MAKRGRTEEKIEIFCQEIMQGKTQRQAYYVAYPASLKWKPETADNKAYVLAKSGEVSARLEELRRESRERSNITRDKLIAELDKIGSAPIKLKDVKPMEKIKAIAEIARMLGYDEAEKGSSTEPIEIILRRK